MAKIIVNTDDAPKPAAGYSQAVKSGGDAHLRMSQELLLREIEISDPSKKNLVRKKRRK